jgi:hypothetical protein
MKRKLMKKQKKIVKIMIHLKKKKVIKQIKAKKNK